MFFKVPVQDLQSVVQLFQEDCNGEVSHRVDFGRFFVDSEENELLLRFNPHAKTIIVARIAFRHTRKGYGTKFLQLLRDFAGKHGFTRIVFESVLTPEAVSFLRKHGFRVSESSLAGGGSHLQDGLGCDWVLGI